MQTRMKFFVILVAIFAMVATASADANPSSCQPAKVGNVGNCFTLDVMDEVGVPILIFKTFGYSDGPRWLVQYTIRRTDGKLDSLLALEKTKSFGRELREELLIIDGVVSVHIVVDEEFPLISFERSSSRRPWEQIVSEMVKIIRDVLLPEGAIKEVKR